MATEGVDLMVNETSGDISSSRSTRPVTGTLLRGLTFLLTIAIVIVGWRAHVPGGMTAINAVAFLLTIVWALVGLVDRHDRESTATRISPFHLLVGLDALVAAVALTAGRLALTHPDNSGGAARVVATIASLLVTAISFHLLLALPDGRLSWNSTTWGRRGRVCARSGCRHRPGGRSPHIVRAGRRGELVAGRAGGHRPDEAPLRARSGPRPGTVAVVRDRGGGGG